MTSKKILKKLSVEEAYKNLENAVEEFVKTAQWESPYNGYSYNNKRITSPINELRKPLLELKLARRK